MTRKNAYIHYVFGSDLDRNPEGFSGSFWFYSIFLFGGALVSLWFTYPHVPAFYLWVILTYGAAFIVAIPAMQDPHKNQRFTYFAYGFAGVAGIVAIDLHFVKLVIYTTPLWTAIWGVVIMHALVVAAYFIADYYAFRMNKDQMQVMIGMTVAYFCVALVAILYFTYAGFFTIVFMLMLLGYQLIAINATFSFRKWYVSLRYKKEVLAIQPLFGGTKEQWEEHEKEVKRIERKKKREASKKRKAEREKAKKEAAAAAESGETVTVEVTPEEARRLERNRKRREAYARKKAEKEAEAKRQAEGQMATSDNDEPPEAKT